MQAPLVPVERIADGPTALKLTAIATGVTQWIGGWDLFWYAWLLLLFVTVADYWIGSARADIEGRYDDNIRRAKFLGKVLGLVLMVFVYWGEALVARTDIVDSHGALAVALTALLIIDELRGLNRHRKELSGKGVPLLGPALDWFERLVSDRVKAVIPPKATEEPEAKTTGAEESHA